MGPDVAPMVVAIVMFLTIGFVAVFRPIAKPLVRLFEAMIREREELPGRHMNQIHGALEQIDRRLHLIEERQSFYEALGSGREAPPLLTSDERPVSQQGPEGPSNPGSSDDT